jgi:hypothetical protein
MLHKDIQRAVNFWGVLLIVLVAIITLIRI